MYASINEVWGQRHPIHKRQAEFFSQEAAQQQTQQQTQQQQPQQQTQVAAQQTAQVPQTTVQAVQHPDSYQQPAMPPVQSFQTTVTADSQIVDILTKLVNLNRQLETVVVKYIQPSGNAPAVHTATSAQQPVQMVMTNSAPATTVAEMFGNVAPAAGVQPVVVFLLMVIVALLSYMVGTSHGVRRIEV